MPNSDPALRREYARQWMARRRAATRKAFLADKACEMCGSTADLEVDHIDPTNKTSHRIWGWSDKRRTAELAKCQVLCKPCHDAKCANEGHGRMIKHGSRKRYEKGCRCQPCRNANTAHSRRVRANQAARRAAA